MKLAYKAFDSSSRQVVNTIEAPDVDEAVEILRRKGLFVATISESDNGACPDVNRTKIRSSKSKRLKNLTMFTRQLHVLVSSGTPLVQSLRALERQTGDQVWRGVITDVRKHVEEGSSLSDAMTAHPGYFDAVCRSMIATGESSGNLSAMLERLASLIRNRIRTRNTIVGALIYPSLLMVVAMSVIVLLLFFVIPRFSALFETLDVALPPSTGFLIVLSTLLRSYWWIFTGLMVGGGVGLKIWLGTPGGKRAIDTLVLRIPQIGRIARDLTTSHIVRMLGLLIESRVPVLDAIRLTREGVRNSHYSDLLLRMEESVSRGESISSTFADTDLISPSIYEATRSGEQSGKVGSMLLHLADFLDEENEMVLKGLTSIIEPVILVFMGVLVGFVALSMFMPLFDLTAITGG